MKRSLLIILLLVTVSLSAGCARTSNDKLEVVKVTLGNISASIPSSGVVEPKNRLEIKAPIAGRVEDVLVNEGDPVKKGQTLAWMSSSDRAALLDAARSKGEEELKYWEGVYKPTPVMAPINGFIIQRSVEPGQSFTSSDAILVMADHLIVKAQVDETDLARIRLNQRAEIILDAYPSESISARVERIAYESEVVNNVTIYQVDVIPNFIPSFLRSGMSANVNFTLSEKRGVLLLPLNAFKKLGGRSYVFIRDKASGKISNLQITIGLENTDHVEVISGLKEGDEVVVPTAKMIESLNPSNRRGPINPFQKKN